MKVLRNKDIKALREKWLSQLKEDILFGTPIEKPCLDHDHVTGHCRAVLDYNSNQILGKVESAWRRFGYKHTRDKLPDFLRRLAGYLEQDYSSTPLHPKHISILIKRHSRMDIKSQIIYLAQLGVKAEELNKLKSKKELNKRYKMELCKKENQYQV